MAGHCFFLTAPRNDVSALPAAPPPAGSGAPPAAGMTSAVNLTSML